MPRTSAWWGRTRPPNPHANGGLLLRGLKMPDFCDYAVDVPKPGTVVAEATRVMGRMLRDVMKLNADAANFRVVGPDETAQPARQRRTAPSRPQDARLLRLCRGRAQARHRRGGSHARNGQDAARRDEAQRGCRELPRGGAGRDRLEPPRRIVRGHQ